MVTGILETLGGVGIFLLGMVVMTDGLRAVAGELLRDVLARFTRSPLSGAVAGALTTAVVQSSSATTVAAIGFVGAGLLGFEQALGIIFGANIGTTITGWLAALLGFRFKLGTAVMPVIFVGVVLRLFGRGRARATGMALAGFGLIFVGIGALQSGMSGLEGIITPQVMPPDTVTGRLMLVAMGMAITVVTQSSSSGVAMALAAIYAGAISLPQAGALVIGMDVGTTATAGLATLGGGTQARRTGFAHVIYNVMTGALAFLLLTPLLDLITGLGQGIEDPGLALVAFHTTFNTLGVIAILPLTSPFARLITRIFPERHDGLVARLDRALLRDPPVAVDASAHSCNAIARAVFRELERALSGRLDPQRARWDELLEAATHVRLYLGDVVTAEGPAHERHVALAHAVDHLERMIERCQKQDRIATVVGHAELAQYAAPLRGALRAATAEAADVDAVERALGEHADELEAAEDAYRARVLVRGAHGQESPQQELAQLDAFRWLRRVVQHAYRVQRYLRSA